MTAIPITPPVARSVADFAARQGAARAAAAATADVATARLPRLEDFPPSFQQPQAWRRGVMGALVAAYLTTIYGVPALCLAFAAKVPAPWSWLAVLAAPLAYAATACLLSLPHQRFVVEGRMRVDGAIPAYFHRRLYGLCWTAVYYSGPLYHALLSAPLLRRALFRGFGYRGSLDVTLYPDTWLRDLPLLRLGAGCYLANKATIGTNMIFLRSGQKWIEVGGVHLGKNVMVGHMAVVGPGSTIGDHAQIGVVAAVGRRATVGEHACIGDGAVLDHGASVAARATVRARCYVGMGRQVVAGEAMAPGQALLRRAASSASVAR